MRIILLALVSGECLVLTTISAYGQSPPKPKPDVVRATILYTGQLFGYMRGKGAPEDDQCLPNGTARIDLRAEGFGGGTGEVGWPEDYKQLGARALPCAIQNRKQRGAVLVGMGDNFAPAYWGRFTPSDQRISRNTQLSTIADDSVALFIHRAGYDAVVPGKEDFYFGAYHLIQVGRLLTKDAHGVMLASNLFLRQEKVKDTPAEPMPAKPSKLRYVPEMDGVDPQFSGEATPWLVSLKFELDPHKVVMAATTEGKFCPASGSDPDDILTTSSFCESWTVWRKQDDSWIQGPIPQGAAWLASKHTFQFIRNLRKEDKDNDFILPGNYGFCLTDTTTVPSNGTHKSKQESPKPYCQLVQILEPMFCYGQTNNCPASLPTGSTGTVVKKYVPYVLVDKDSEGSVAIFGVVDENLRSYIARENASWEPRDNLKCAFRKPCRTGIHVVAPDAVLQQVLEHFSIAHPEFGGVKILLAQMTKAMADELAAHIEDPTTDPESAIGFSTGLRSEDEHARAFDAVFARASEADATPNAFLQIRNAKKRRPAVFVPRPIYDSDTKITINSLNELRIQREYKEGIISFCNSLIDDQQETDCRGLQPPPENQDGKLSPKNQEDKATQRQKENLMPYVVTALNPSPKPPENKAAFSCKEPPNDARSAVCDILTKYGKNFNSNGGGTNDSKEWFEKTLQQFTLNALVDYKEILTLSPGSRSRSRVKNSDSWQAPTSDVAVLQVRDFWYGTAENTHIMIEHVQELLDRILWKDDLLTETNLSGSQIKKLFEQSDKFDTEEKDASLVLPDTRDRGIIKSGLVVKEKQSPTGEDHYYSHADDFENGGVYRVATSNYLGSGDTGYPDAGKPATGKPQISRNGQAIPISLIVCKALFQLASEEQKQIFNCRSEINLDNDYRVDHTQILSAAVRPEESRWDRIGTFFTNFGLPSNPYKDSQGEKRLQSYPVTDINLDKISVGYTLSSPDASVQTLKSFSGITNSDISQPASSKLDVDQHLRVLHRFRWRLDAGIEDLLEYTRQTQDSFTSPTSTNWPRNNFIIGPVLQLRGLWLKGDKYRPHFLYVVRPFQFAIQPTDTTFTLTGASSTSALVSQRRSYSYSPKFGFRFERDEDSYLETGVQSQHNYNVLSALLLNPGSGLPPCQLSAAQSLADCAQNVTLNPNTPPQAQYSQFVQQGMYWDAKLKIPFATKQNYQLDTHGDLFANRPLISENSALPRYDVVVGNSLQIHIIGNFSFEPRFEWVFYENKVLGSTLTRRNFSMQLTYSFKHESRVPVRNTMNYDSDSGTAKSEGK